jgi:hypothetical protein
VFLLEELNRIHALCLLSEKNQCEVCGAEPRLPPNAGRRSRGRHPLTGFHCDALGYNLAVAIRVGHRDGITLP